MNQSLERSSERSCVNESSKIKTVPRRVADLNPGDVFVADVGYKRIYIVLSVRCMLKMLPASCKVMYLHVTESKEAKRIYNWEALAEQLVNVVVL